MGEVGLSGQSHSAEISDWVRIGPRSSSGQRPPSHCWQDLTRRTRTHIAAFGRLVLTEEKHSKFKASNAICPAQSSDGHLSFSCDYTSLCFFLVGTIFILVPSIRISRTRSQPVCFRGSGTSSMHLVVLLEF